jgi:hypothetical protein
MPRNPESERRKRHVVSLVQQRLGSLCLHHPRRADWYSAEDGMADIFITDSKATYHQRPWFDMRNDDLKELARHSAGFVIFILGDDTCYLVIPARDLVAQLPNHREGLLATGFYHFNTVLGKRTFEQLPDWDFSQYVGGIDLIPCSQK